MLELRNIKKDYVLSDQTVHALKGITLDFRKNEFVSVLGPSGCGKTTLMNIVGGLDKYTDGELVINGRCTKEYSEKEWDNYRNKKIGFVFQTYNLIPHQTVLSNVELALTLSGISLEERKQKAKEALTKVGLSDQINKRPNQLSGGQMQRVAIARALVNSPDILLADEPTGALDTATSEQIMELIREIAGEKLVIMVTHNPELAYKYSSRIVKMLDGEILSDSDPYDSAKDVGFKNEITRIETVTKLATEKKKRGKKEKTSMSFLTALSLSMKNLLTKKGRTILTSIAGSIGIIGICLILALSNGMNKYIAKMTTDTMAGSPITISETAFDFTQAMGSFNGTVDLEKYPLIDKVFVQKLNNMNSMMIKNIITQEYLDYLTDNLKNEWFNDVNYKTGLNLNVFTVSPENGEYGKVTKANGWQMLLKNSFVDTQYEVLSGNLPENTNDIILIVDEYNRLGDTTLVDLGIRATEDEADTYDFETLMQKEYKIVLNDGLYAHSGTKFVEKAPNEIDYAEAITVKISGIIRLNQATEYGVLGSGVGYSKELYNLLLENNKESQIVGFMEDNPTINPIKGMEYTNNPMQTKEEQRTTDLRKFGGILTPNEISIFATGFEAKEQIKTVLRNFNVGKEESESVIFTDMSEMMGDMMSQMVNIISYVLIGFTAISLIVSCVMIGIITYISVIERTKEIGILRAIGARKKDITRVFNAETFIIGMIAGIIGVLVTALLTIPVNAIIVALTGVAGIAKLSVVHAIIMVGISILLTLVSGLIPAFKASKKDPVLALRTE